MKSRLTHKCSLWIIWGTESIIWKSIALAMKEPTVSLTYAYNRKGQKGCPLCTLYFDNNGLTGKGGNYRCGSRMRMVGLDRLGHVQQILRRRHRATNQGKVARHWNLRRRSGRPSTLRKRSVSFGKRQFVPGHGDRRRDDRVERKRTFYFGGNRNGGRIVPLPGSSRFARRPREVVRGLRSRRSGHRLRRRRTLLEAERQLLAAFSRSDCDMGGNPPNVSGSRSRRGLLQG